MFSSEQCTEDPLNAQYISMNRTVVPGLEVAPSTNPEVTPQSDEDKYCNEPEIQSSPNLNHSGRSDFHRPIRSTDHSQLKSQSLVKTITILIIVLLLAVALGVGLGVGLSAQHKQIQSK